MEDDMQNSPYHLDSFDFDAWAALAQDNPAAFNELRQRHIEEMILEHCRRRKTDPRKFLGLQWRIDVEIRKARTPLKACLRLSSMMWDSFYEMRAALDPLLDGCRKHSTKEVSTQPSAKLHSASARILPFVKRQDTP
jgi:hypothetical protein